MAPAANLVGVKVLTGGGSGTEDGIVRGIEWAVENREKFNIRIISLSLGGFTIPGVTNDGNSAMSRASEAAAASNIAVVVAAGNEGPAPESIRAPGDARKVITVGSIGDNLDLSDFSSRGPVGNAWDSYLKPEVVAPGESVIAPEANSGNEY